jgi:subtilisin family serine protease/PKD repeat protein
LAGEKTGQMPLNMASGGRQGRTGFGVLRTIGPVVLLLCWYSPALAQQPRHYSLPAGVEPARFAPDQIVVKVAAPAGSHAARTGSGAVDAITRVAEYIDALSVSPAFPALGNSAARQELDPRVRELSQVYKLRLPPGRDVLHEINRLLRLDYVVYAEPAFSNELLYVPNDPQANPSGGAQDYLKIMKVHEAWDVSKGDSTIVVGLVDTGVQLAHPDLADNLAFNLADPINGIDDDGDGYIDNYLGWDLADGDNNPNADNSGHGSFVAGLSSARADNGIGMAGIGLKSKYLPVKVSASANNVLINEYEGIIYAADHGCKVINLSWGGVYPFFRYGQDVINYAVLYRDAVVVAAAGNTPKDLAFYPASFDNVLSVGATNKDDTKASWATWSYFIDLMAPGNNVYTTNNSSGYSGGYGSSFSAPQVAGAAALVRKRFPAFNARQVMEQLRVTADDIYGVGSNMNFYGMMGRGRLNVFRAVTEQMMPSIRMTEMNYRGSYDQYIFHSDTLHITSSFTNFLRYAKGAEVSLSSATPGVFVENGRHLLGNMAEMIEAGNETDPFRIRLGKDHQPGERLVFRLDIEAEDYRDFQYFTLYTTPDYFPVTNNSVTLTVASDGDLAYNRDSLREGTGLYAYGQYLAHWLGLVISTDSLRVMDNVVNNLKAYTRDQDFEVIEHARLYKNSLAGLDARSVFRPSTAKSNRLDIEVEQKILGWKESGEGDYLILEYRISNPSGQSIDGLNAGLFADWNIRQSERNVAEWDASHGIGYVYEKSNPNLLAGVALLSEGAVSYRAIDLGSYNGNSAELDSLFTDAQKHRFLSGGIQKLRAGEAGNGNDVAQMLGQTGLNLLAGGSVRVAFVLLFGTSLEELRTQRQAALDRYREYLTYPPVETFVEACLGDSAVIDPSWGERFEFYSDPGLSLRLDSGLVYRTPPVIADFPVYAVNLDRGYRSDARQILVKAASPQASYRTTGDTVFIEQGGYQVVHFENTSADGESWSWDFGNGYHSTVKDPHTVYNQAGVFPVTLVAYNQLGCADSIRRDFVVAYRSPRPVLSDQTVCLAEGARIEASNSTRIRVYSGADAGIPVFEGDAYQSGPLQADTVFYVTNIDGPESLPVPVQVSVQRPPLGIIAQADTLDLGTRYRMTLLPQSNAFESLRWYIDGIYAGDQPQLSHDYGGRDFTVAQVMTDLSGCSDSIALRVSVAASLQPGMEDIQVCRGSAAWLRPSNGTVFHFYGDAGMNQLLHKGREYRTPEVHGERTYYIAGMDQLLEGPVREVRVFPSALKAGFRIDPDTLNLESGDEAGFINTSEGAAWSYWTLPGGATDTRSDFTMAFDAPGAYTFELVAGDDAECVQRVSGTLVVLSVTGLGDQHEHRLAVYPNPAERYLFLRNAAGLNLSYVEIIDQQGRRMWSGQPDRAPDGMAYLDVYGLPQGLFILKIYTGDLVYSGKFLKR